MTLPLPPTLAQPPPFLSIIFRPSQARGGKRCRAAQTLCAGGRPHSALYRSIACFCSPQRLSAFPAPPGARAAPATSPVRRRGMPRARLSGQMDVVQICFLSPAHSRAGGPVRFKLRRSPLICPHLPSGKRIPSPPLKTLGGMAAAAARRLRAARRTRAIGAWWRFRRGRYFCL